MEEIYFADYDYRAQTKAIRRAEAKITKAGEAIMRLKGGKMLKKDAGEFLKKDEFEIYWRGCIEHKARQMAEEMNNAQAEL